MRRFFPMAVLALLMVAVAAPVNAGYLIIRILLDGSSDSTNSGNSSGTSTTGPSSVMPSPSGGGLTGPKRGSGFGPPGGLKPPPGGLTMPGPMGGGMPGTAPHTTTHLDPTRSLIVVVPVTEEMTTNSPFYKLPLNSHTNPMWKPKLHFNLRGQTITTNLFTDSTTIQWYQNLLQTPGYKRIRPMDVYDRHDRWAKTKTDTKQLFDILVSALQVGLIPDALTYSDELLAAAADSKELAPEVAGFVRAYGAMQSGIRGTPPKPNRAAYWQAKLDAKNTYTNGHYSLIYWDSDASEVQRRAATLEENFVGFYLSYAIRGIELPVPEAPLVAVLAKRGVDVLPLARALDAPTFLLTDGFYSAEHDVLVLSPERLDDLGQTFIRQANQIYTQGVARETLLAGKGPRIHKDGEKLQHKPDEVVMTPDDVAWMQTIALVDRYLDESSAIAVASREGSRQLLYTTGQLPRYVSLPEWLSNGSVNYFSRPRDPAFVTDADGKWRVSVAPTTGYGGPNPILQRYFRDFIDKKELNADRGELLKNVLTDAYFHGLRDPREARDPDPEKADKSGVALSNGGGQPNLTTPGTPGGPGPGIGIGKPPKGGSGLGPPPGGMPMGIGPGSGPVGPGVANTPAHEEDPNAKLRKKRERLSTKAQATSWALYYYIAKSHPAELQKFRDELAALPRDLPLDGTTMMAAFCRAFALDGSKESLRKFADKWIEQIGIVAPASTDVPLVDPKPVTPPTTGGTQPGNGGYPPGYPPGGPGGSGGSGGGPG